MVVSVYTYNNSVRMNSKFNQIKKLKNHLQNKCQLCQNCSEKKLYKCMQSSCVSSRLICPKCDVFNLKGNHYDHRFTYALLLFTQSRPQLILNMHQQMRGSLLEVKHFLERCIGQLQKALQQNKKAEQNFRQVLFHYKLPTFLQALNNLKDFSSLDEVLADVRFLTKREGKRYLEHAATFNKQSFKACLGGRYRSNKSTIMRSLTEEIIKMTQPNFNALFDPFYLLNKEIITVEKENQKFRNFKQVYSDNWAYTSVRIKVEEKSNVQSKLCPFQSCRKLEIIQTHSRLQESQPDVRVQINFPNLRQVTIYGNDDLLERTKNYCSKAKVINIHSPTLWDPRVLTYFSSLQEANLFFKRFNQEYHSFSYLELLLKFKCPVISIACQEKVKFYWDKMVLCAMKDKIINAQSWLVKLSLDKIDWREWPTVFRQLRGHQKLFKFSVPIKLDDPRETKYIQSMIIAQRKQLNKTGLEKEKAVVSLAKEYKLKKFIRGTKTRSLFQDLYRQFLID